LWLPVSASFEQSVMNMLDKESMITASLPLYDDLQVVWKVRSY